MKSLKTLILSAFLLVGLSAPSWAALPWGSTAPLEVTSTTPTCTYTSTALACVSLMSGNTTALTLAGMTAGTYYTIIFVMDGTGSRTLTQASITAASGGPALPAITTAANSYQAWVILATSASAATFVASYDNVDLSPFFTATQATNGTAITGGTIQAQPTVVVPGMSVSHTCTCLAQTQPASWNTAVTLSCLPLTNALQCVEQANNGVVTITPTAVTVNIRIQP